MSGCLLISLLTSPNPQVLNQNIPIHLNYDLQPLPVSPLFPPPPFSLSFSPECIPPLDIFTSYQETLPRVSRRRSVLRLHSQTIKFRDRAPFPPLKYLIYSTFHERDSRALPPLIRNSAIPNPAQNSGTVSWNFFLIFGDISIMQLLLHASGQSLSFLSCALITHFVYMW